LDFEQMSIHIVTYGPKESICNICGDFGRLTKDHTPPKGAININQVEMLHIIDHLNAEKPTRNTRKSQNGVKYRTLCSRCNNGLLGTKYDPAFISFVSNVGGFLRTKIQLPRIINVPSQPQKLMRAVLGHLSAQGVNRYDHGKDTEPLRDYFIDESLPLPNNIDIYYWVYPYKSQVQVRDCCYMDIRIGEPVIIWFIKFFPIAFLVTWDKPQELNIQFPNLDEWRNAGIEEEIEIPVHLDRIAPQFWPETPMEHSVVTYGKEAIVALGRTKPTRR
jgi:hypothetical protein